MTLRLFICLFILMCGALQAAVTPNRSLTSPYQASGSGLGSHPATPTSNPQTLQHLQTSPQAGSQQQQLGAQPRGPASIPLSNQAPVYFHPGVLVLYNGRWEGGDHLYNLPNTIGVFIEVVKPQDDKTEINEARIHQAIESIFAQFKITPNTITAFDQPPLPFFHVQILLYPISRGYVSCIAGRLFESVSLKRIIFDPGMAFQAITWEKKSLIVSGTDTIAAQVESSVATIAQAFGERFQANALRRQDLQGN